MGFMNYLRSIDPIPKICPVCHSALRHIEVMTHFVDDTVLDLYECENLRLDCKTHFRICEDDISRCYKLFLSHKDNCFKKMWYFSDSEGLSYNCERFEALQQLLWRAREEYLRMASTQLSWTVEGF